MNVIILDSDSVFRASLTHDLEAALPDALIMEYDPISYGPPSSDFDWSVYDVMLLGANSGDEHIGWPWFAPDVHAEQFPGVVLLSSAEDGEIPEQAAEINAVEYLHKSDARGEDLRDLIVSVENNRAKYGRSHRGNARGVPKRGSEVSRAGDAHGKIESVQGYRLLDRLGQGARSTVYLARALTGPGLLAIKVLKPECQDSADVLPRFIQEAELMASIKHPNVVKVIEQGFTDASAYLAMEFFAGGNLRRRLDFGPVEVDARTYALQILRGLSAIHAAGVVHRYVTPTNVLFRSDNVAAIAEFGWSKVVSGSRELTSTGQTIGSPAYMSPEQGMGEAVDGRSDLYSFGVLVYEMLTGALPFTGRTGPAVLRQHLEVQPPRLGAEHAAWQPLLDDLLAKQPADRPNSADEVLARVQEAGAG